MIPEPLFSKGFKKQYKKMPKPVQQKFIKALALFIADPSDHRLRNHALHRPYIGQFSIRVDSDYRAHYRVEDTVPVFMDIGTHSQLYKK
jgi:addiction module RelE/StbE family toxin